MGTLTRDADGKVYTTQKTTNIVNSKYGVAPQADGSIRIDVEDGTVLKTRGECGMFVNDILK